MTWINDDPFDEMIKRIFKQFGFDGGSPIGAPNVRSWSYGFTMTRGPDGKPVIRELGNLPSAEGFNINETQEEDLLTQVDIDEKNNVVRILAEIPGVSKKDLKINATENKVVIRAGRDSGTVTKEIPVGLTIDPETADASYNNGVLDLSFKLAKERHEGKEIEVN